MRRPVSSPVADLPRRTIRSRRLRTLLPVVLVALLTTVAGCTDGGPETPPGTTGSPSTSPSDRPSTPASSASPSGDDPADREDVDPGDDPLEWRPVPGPVGDVVTVSGDWTLTVDAEGARATLAGPTPATIPAGRRGRISDALLDGDYALVVSQDRLERRPSTATVVELATGRRFVLDGRSAVPTVTGGTWALGGGHAYYATTADGAYCLASVDLAAGSSTVWWCAPDRQGFAHAHATATGGVTLMAFDDARPSCRTVGLLPGPGEPQGFEGVPACKGWEGVLLPDGSRVWSEIPQERRIETARVVASHDGRLLDLGPAVSGSLLTCGSAAYFARDPVREGEPAQVLRWSQDGRLDVVYEAPAGADGFVVSPLRCGGDRLTLTALAEGGDEQVSAPVD